MWICLLGTSWQGTRCAGTHPGAWEEGEAQRLPPYPTDLQSAGWPTRVWVWGRRCRLEAQEG